MTTQILVIIGQGNVLLPNDTKLFLKPKLQSNWYSDVAFNWEQFHTEGPR